MMRLTNKTLELMANAAIIALALLLGWLAIKRHFFTPARQPASLESPALVGSRLALHGGAWAGPGPTVLLALSTHCRYCTESAPFYRRLAQALATRPDTKLLAVLPEDSAEGQRYLQALGVPGADVRQAPLPAIGIRGTPTLLVLDNTGVVVNAWIGQLNAADESEVWRVLQLTDDRAQAAKAAAAAPPSIEVAQLRAALARHEQVFLLDVRERAEFKQRHIPGAQNIPLDELGVRAPNELPADGLVVVYAACARCPGEGQSRIAQQLMLDLGFRQTVVLRGGLDSWTQAGPAPGTR